MAQNGLKFNTMEKLFTKGKWILNYPNTSEENPPFIIGTDPFEGFILNPICELKQKNETNTFDLDEWEANAKLIAAAPEMLNTLEEIEEYITRMGKTSISMQNIKIKVREAIKKAIQ